jgi:hypothetical protein
MYLKTETYGGEFNILRLSDALRNYMGFSVEHFFASAPYVRLLTVSYSRPEIFMRGWREETIPYPVASLWLVIGALLGLFFVRRLERCALFVGYATCLLLQAVLILSFYFVTQRYGSELLPVLCLLGLPWVRFTSFPRWTAVVLGLLVVSSSYVTVASTLDWDMVHNGDSSLAYKRRLRSMLVPSTQVSGFDGRIVYLSDLDPISETSSFAPMRWDRNVDGAEFDVGGRVLPKGLGVHAHSRLTYAVPASAIMFSALLSPSSGEMKCLRMSYRMRVFGGSDKVLFESETFHSRSLPVSIDVDVSGISTVTLEVVPLEDGIDCDHANWIMAQFRFRE